MGWLTIPKPTSASMPKSPKTPEPPPLFLAKLPSVWNSRGEEAAVAPAKGPRRGAETLCVSLGGPGCVH